MQDLTLVGLTEDGTALILVGETGERYKLPADARLRAALRTDQTRPGQGEKKMDSVLRPRDIQTRIRSGESPEAVAEAARTTVDKIMGFAAPVLAERAYVAEQAQKASIRRRAGDGQVGHLGETVTQRLRGAKVDLGTVDWDAWRRDDGRWTLVVDYHGADGPERAEFVYDAAGRYVTAEDDQARWLVGERAGADRSGTARRLTPVHDEQLPLGDDAIEVVTGRRPVDPPLQLTFDDAQEADEPEPSRAQPRAATPPTAGDDSLTEDLGEVADAIRGPRSTTPPTADADWISTQASERPARATEPTPAEQPVEQPAADHDEGAQEQPTPAQSQPQPKDKTRGKSKGKGRASVPSWDEIMFGSGRND